MKKVFVNITSYIGSVGAEHYYAKTLVVESVDNIFVLVRKGWPYGRPTLDHEELYKRLSQADADHLNKKERRVSYRKGELTQRFDSPEEIKETVKTQFPGCDLAFFDHYNLKSEENDVFEANPNPIKKTGKKIKIRTFEGFSKEFVHLTRDSVHECISVPEKFEGKELQNGEWVWGVTEPVLVLRREFEYVNE